MYYRHDIHSVLPSRILDAAAMTGAPYNCSLGSSAQNRPISPERPCVCVKNRTNASEHRLQTKCMPKPDAAS